MGRCSRKREGPGEVAETGGRSRKIIFGELEISASSVQLKTRRLDAMAPFNSALPASSDDSICESVSSGNVLTSCCSSIRSSEVDEEIPKFEDPEENAMKVEHFAKSSVVDFRESREKTPPSEVTDSGELESTALPHESNSRRFPTAAEKTTAEAELEEFFAAAEKKLQKQFIDKYNFDIVEDEPLEGRYEWVPVQLKP